MEIVTGGDVAFSALLYPQQNQAATMDYIVKQFENLPSTITDMGRRFIDEAYTIVNKINDSTAMAIARNALQKAGSFVYMEFIKPIFSPKEIQEAPMHMQRWLMAEPSIRKEYIKGRVAGFKDSYQDKDPGVVGEDHYDYRRVMDGVLYQDEKGDYWIDTHFEDLDEGDEELSHDEKFDILQTWEAARSLMKIYRSDLTDPYVD